MSSTPLSPYNGRCTCDAPPAPIRPEVPQILVKALGRAGCTCEPFPRHDGLGDLAWTYASVIDRRIMLARSCMVSSQAERIALERMVYAEFPLAQARAHQRGEFLRRARDVIRYGVNERSISDVLTMLRLEYEEVVASCADEIAAMWTARAERIARGPTATAGRTS